MKRFAEQRPIVRPLEALLVPACQIERTESRIGRVRGILIGGILWLALAGTLVAAPTPDQPGGIRWSPFGIGSCYVNNRSAQDDARWIPQMAAIGIHVMRTCHTEWRNVEPEARKWTWQALDSQLSYMTSNKMEFGGLLLGSVPWDKSAHAAGLPVSNPSA